MAGINQPGAAAPQTDISVTTTLDVLNGSDGLCSLREAVIAANTNLVSGGVAGECPAGSSTVTDVIHLPAGTYTLTRTGRGEDAALTGDLDIAQSVTILGAGRSLTIIDGNAIDRVLHIPIMYSSAAMSLTLSDLTITGGDLPPTLYCHPGCSGGGISAISSNHLYLTNVTLSNNAAGEGMSELSSGQGGAIHLNGANATFDRVWILDNVAGMGGGMTSSGAFTAIDSLWQGNSSTHYGGGVHLEADSAVIFDIQRSTFAGNISGTSGGGINLLSGILQLTNSTVSGNWAQNFMGGGILAYYESSFLDLSFVTIANNQAGSGAGLFNAHQQGLFAPNPPPQGVQSKGTIFANNIGPNCGFDLQILPPTTLGGNVDTSLDNACQFSPDVDLPNATVLLGPLQDNGGLTPTMALLSGSDGLDFPTGALCIAEDQRGTLRSSPCDSGAFEYLAGSDANLDLSMTGPASVANLGDPVNYDLTLHNSGPNATSASVTVTLPAGFGYTGYSGAAWDCVMNGSLLTCDLLSALGVGLDAGALQVSGTAPGSGSSFTLRADASASLLDPDLTDNQASVTTLLPQPEQADLSVVLNTPASSMAGDPIAITVQVENLGTDPASNVDLIINLPAGITNLSASGTGWACAINAGQVTCGLSSLAVGSANPVTINGTAPALAGDVGVQGTVSSDTLDPNLVNNLHSINITVNAWQKIYLPLTLRQ